MPGILALQAPQHPRETASLISWDEPSVDAGIARQGLSVSQPAETPSVEASQQFGERDSNLRWMRGLRGTDGITTYRIWACTHVHELLHSFGCAADHSQNAVRH